MLATAPKELLCKVIHTESFREQDKTAVKVLRLSVERGAFPYKAGQFALLACPEFKLRNNPNALRWAPFSIASSPLQPYLEFCIGVKHTGGLTQYIDEHITVGSQMYVKGPYGDFLLDKSFNEVAFIALGTGIAPLISMIRTLMLEKDTRPIHLFYGFRNSYRYVYRQELEEYSKHDNFHLNVIASNPDTEWHGKAGFVQQLIEHYSFTHDRADVDVYICGPPVAMDAIQEFLIKQGFSRNKIHRERW
jgi:predicted ferric reductase